MKVECFLASSSWLQMRGRADEGKCLNGFRAMACLLVVGSIETHFNEHSSRFLLLSLLYCQNVQVEAVGRTRCSIFLCSSRASICLLSCSGDFVAFHENEDLRGLKAHQHLVGESFHVCSSCQPMVSLCCSFFVLLDYLRGSGRSREQQQTNKPPHG
jgi:hypothetical protein